MSQICLTTACAPWFALPDLVPRLKQAGYDGIEVGLNDRKWDPAKSPDFWGNNQAMLDWSQAQDEAAQLRQVLDQHGLPCAAIASYVQTDDIDRIAVAVEVARILGCEFIRVRVPWYGPGCDYRSLLEQARTTYRDLAQISQETGVDSLIEIHDNSICPTASAAMRVLEGLDPSLVGVIFDPGNYAREGFESLPMVIDLLGPYLRHVHVKNGRVAMSETTNSKGIRSEGPNCDLADGLIDWPQLITWLQGAGYDGWYSLENFRGLESPDRRLQEDANWLRTQLTQATEAV